MRKILLALVGMLFPLLAFAQNVIRTPLNEYSTQVINQQGKPYTEIGAGINYQKDDGSWGEASNTFVASQRTGIDWECYTTYNRVGLKNDISTGAYSIFTQLGNTGKILKSKPVAIAYLNIDTKAWQIFANLQSSVAVVNGNKIHYPDAFLNCDLEYVIEKDRLKQNLYIKSKAGFPASPYPADKTAVVIVTKFDLANYELPKFVDERGSTEFNDSCEETITGELHFSKQYFDMSEATDNVGKTQKIRKRLIKYNGEYYLLEGLPYQWLASASYPVLLDYTEISSNPADDTTWASGTYYVSATISAHGLIVSAGVIVKSASQATINVDGINANGTATSWVYFTSKNDNTVGDTIEGSSGTPAAGDWVGFSKTQWQNTHADVFQNVVLRYATNGYLPASNYYGSATLVNTFNDMVIKNCSTRGLYITGRSGGTIKATISDCQVDTCGLGIGGISKAYGDIVITRCLVKGNTTCGIGNDYFKGAIRNCTIDSNTLGLHTHQAGSDMDLYDCIISNNTTNLSIGANGTIDLNYCLQYNNGTTNAPSANNNPLTSADPVYATGTAATGYIGNMAYFLNQATSPCIDAGSDTAANLSMNAHTTATDKTLDGDTVDVGYHYEPNDVGSGAPSFIEPCQFGLVS